MEKRRPLSFVVLIMVLLAGIGGGMLIQAKVQSTLAQGAESTALVRGMTRSLESCATALNHTTAERNRLLEHLADVESGTDSADCIPVMVWLCPVNGGAK